MTVDGVECFCDASRGVFFVAVSPNQALSDLHRDLLRVLARLTTLSSSVVPGHEGETYRPHLTLLREVPEAEVDATKARFAGFRPARTFRVDSISLICHYPDQPWQAGVDFPLRRLGRPARCPPRIMKAILIVIDGMRPDALEPARTPNLCGLMEAGAYTLAARTVNPSITLPCHASLFLSLPPESHGIDTNVWTAASAAAAGSCGGPAAGRPANGLLFNWEELRDLAPPGALHASLYLNNCSQPDGDLELADLAAGWLRRNDVDFAFLYLGYTDNAGHDFGWMSEAYLSALSRADTAAGRVLAVLPPDVVIVVCSDHGGSGTSHGTECAENVTIPVIIAGHPGLPAGSRFAGSCQHHRCRAHAGRAAGRAGPGRVAGARPGGRDDDDRDLVSRVVPYREVIMTSFDRDAVALERKPAACTASWAPTSAR